MSQVGKVLLPIPGGLVVIGLTVIAMQGFNGSLGFRELVAFTGIFTTIVLFLWRRMDGQAAKLTAADAALSAAADARHAELVGRFNDLVQRLADREAEARENRGRMQATLEALRDRIEAVRQDMNGMGSKMTDRFLGQYLSLEEEQKHIDERLRRLESSPGRTA